MNGMIDLIDPHIFYALGERGPQRAVRRLHGDGGRDGGHGGDAGERGRGPGDLPFAADVAILLGGHVGGGVAGLRCQAIDASMPD